MAQNPFEGAVPKETPSPGRGAQCGDCPPPIRRAEVSDLSAIAALYRVLFADMAALQPRVWRPSEMSRSFILELIAGQRSSVLVAERGGEIVGFAVVQDRDTPPLGCIIKNRFCFLLDIVVAPALRGQGLGRALVSAAEEWAKERGLAWLELNVLSENIAAIKLYEHMGMGAAQLTMRKMFD